MVKKETKETAPAEAIEQGETVIPHIIEALSTAPLSEDPIYFSKLDIKDGFWRTMCAVGEESNLTYILPNHPEAPTKLVLLSVLQMEWTLSPFFYHVESETARDKTESYAQMFLGHFRSIHSREEKYQNY